MKVKVAKTAGFCSGVRRAVEMAEKAAQEDVQLCTLGELIHNPIVLEHLASQGVVAVERVEDIPTGQKVIIRSHGVPRSVYEYLDEHSIPYIDATCPYVLRIHRLVEDQPKGAHILIVGDKNHPEVLGIVGHCNNPCSVVKNVEELEARVEELKREGQIDFILLSQTTYDTKEWKKSTETAKKVCTNLNIFDTICKATITRQEEAQELSRQADVMVVVGGRHSSNTKKLYDICRSNCSTIWVERAEELEEHQKLLSQANLVGITAGASTPACIIKEVQHPMNRLDNINNDMTFEEMLDQSFKSTYNGEKVIGVVTGIKYNEISVDIGTKHACYVPLHELTDDPTAKPEDLVKIGDEIELQVIRINDVEGTTVLSKRRLDQAAGFEKVMNAAETGEILTGKVTEVIKGGVLVLTNGVKVFIPASQSGVPRDGDLNSILHKEVQFKILETNRQRRRALGSISVILREQRKILADQFWAEVEVGKAYTGVVKSITNFGVFVDLGGVDGRIALTDLTWLRVKHPSDVVNVGDTVEVTIKDIDTENHKVSLIYKKSEDNPWELIRTKHQVGDVVHVKIMSITAFGAFAQIIPGIDGLIHISQIAQERVEKVADKLKVGDEVDAVITELDYEKKRASLSIKALLSDETSEENALSEEGSVEE